MKNLRILISIISVFLLYVEKGSAQMDNLVNMSSDWVRSGARNASTDAADAVVYNPAGLTQLENGFHISLSNQSLFRSPSHEYDLGLGQGVKSHSQKGADAFLPSIYGAYKNNNWAIFTGVYVAGGGATMNYPNGSITTDLIGLQAVMSTEGAYTDISSPRLKASSYYLTTTLGGSYQVSPRFSMALALRYINAKNTAEAGMNLTASPYDLPDMPLELNTEEQASGMGAVIGFNYMATTGLNISARYESQVSLNFVTNQIRDDFGFTNNGDKNHRDLPSVLALGISYDVNEKVELLADYNYYFQKNADWGKSGTATEEKKWSSLAGNASAVSAAVQYKVSPAFIYSCGAGLSHFDFTDREAYYTKLGQYEVALDNNWNINTGFVYKATEVLSLNFGYMHTFWKKDHMVKALNADPLDVDVKVNNAMDAVSIGINLHF